MTVENPVLGANRGSALVTMGAGVGLVLVLGAVRMKLIALALGPTGIGELGLVVTAISALATLLGLGLGTGAVVPIAASANDTSRHTAVLAALRWSTWFLAGLGGVVSFAGWKLLGPEFVSVDRTATAIMVGLAVAATIASARFTAVLSGLGSHRRLAVAQVSAAATATALLLASYGADSAAVLFVAILAPPVALLVTTWLSAARVSARESAARKPWRPELRIMLTLGAAVGSSAVMMNASQFVATAWSSNRRGPDAGGLFQASWAIAALYLAFVLAVLNVEHLPRLSQLHGQERDLLGPTSREITRLVLVATPLVLAMASAAPLVLRLLYAPEFTVAAPALRWFLAGDIFKVMAWPLAYLLLARHLKSSYFLSELTWNITFLGLTLALLPFTAQGAGIAYAAANAVFLTQLAYRTGYRPGPRDARYVALAVAVLILIASGSADNAVSWIAAAAAALAAAYGWNALRRAAP